MRLGYIYIIRNTVNEKVYIGKTSNTIEERFLSHKKPSVLKQRHTYKLYNAMNKYGTDKFFIESIDRAPIEKLDDLEIMYIEKFDSYRNGYNSTLGGKAKAISSITDVRLLEKLFNEGKTHKEIALVFGVNKATVQRTLHSIGLTRNKRVTKEFLIDNLNLYNYEIAELLGVHQYTVTRAFKKYNIPRGTGCNNYKNHQNQVRCIDYPVGE